jgi:uncharacterized membrane protein YoaK (UPF0700 family)
VAGKTSPQRWLCPALAFVAGFLDAASFVQLGGVFCAHVTGNLVVVVSELAQLHRPRWSTVATVPVFLLAVALVNRLARPRWTSAPRARGIVLAFEATFVGLATLFGTLVAPGSSTATDAVILLLLVVAMAAQSALHRMFPELGPCSTVMTGNLAHWVLKRSEPVEHKPAGSAWQQHGTVVASFSVGCVLGAGLVKQFGLGALSLPLCVLCGGSYRLLGLVRSASRDLPSGSSTAH